MVRGELTFAFRLISAANLYTKNFCLFVSFSCFITHYIVLFRVRRMNIALWSDFQPFIHPSYEENGCKWNGSFFPLGILCSTCRGIGLLASFIHPDPVHVWKSSLQTAGSSLLALGGDLHLELFVSFCLVLWCCPQNSLMLLCRV